LRERLRSVLTIPYDFSVCQVYAEIREKIRQSGKSVAPNDLWIAACAIRHAIPLVSNNRSDFEAIPSLVLITESPVVEEIQSQGSLRFGGTSTETGKPSSQSPSSEPEKG
jgi:hypothetical protein